MTMSVVIMPVSHVFISIRPGTMAFALTFVILVITFIHSSICIGEAACSVFLVIVPVSLVCISIRPGAAAIPMTFVILKVTKIFPTIRPGKAAPTMHLIILIKIPFVYLPTGVDQLTFYMHFPIGKLSSIDVSFLGTFTVCYVALPMAQPISKHSLIGSNTP